MCILSFKTHIISDCTMKKFKIRKLLKYFRRVYRRRKRKLAKGGECVYCCIRGRLRLENLHIRGSCISGLFRCITCHIWYCSGECYNRHFHLHKTDCSPIKEGLIWPDGTKFFKPSQGHGTTGKKVCNEAIDVEEQSPAETNIAPGVKPPARVIHPKLEIGENPVKTRWHNSF